MGVWKLLLMLNQELPPASRLCRAIIDSDGKLRRSPLAAKLDQEAIKYSLPLAEITAFRGVALEHGNRAGDPIRFGSTV